MIDGTNSLTTEQVREAGRVAWAIIEYDHSFLFVPGLGFVDFWMQDDDSHVLPDEDAERVMEEVLCEQPEWLHLTDCDCEFCVTSPPPASSRQSR